MVHEVKILLYPEDHKSKNGPLFERLMRTVFEYEGYNIDQNLNFTGLEIDLWGKHVNREELLLIECKAKQKPLSTEIKNFAYNVNHFDANYGYFFYTEELDHHAAGLVKEMKDKPKKYKNLYFFGPDKIIQTLAKSRVNFIRDYNGISVLTSLNIYKVIFAYTYFGKFYIFIDINESVSKNYYLYNAETLKEIPDVNDIADSEHSSVLTIDQVLKQSIGELQKLKHKTNIVKKKSVSKSESVTIDEKFDELLDDLGTAFLHSKVEELKLSDIFVQPNLRKINSENSKRKELNAFKLWSLFEKISSSPLKLVITGDEVSGKTTVAKRIFHRLYNQGMYPLLINGEEIKHFNKDQLIKNLNTFFSKQYNNSSLELIDKNQLVLIIDDFDKFKYYKKEEFRDIFLQNINDELKNVVLLGDSLMVLDSKTRNNNVVSLLSKYEVYNLLEFGPMLRHELVEKWYCLGQDINLIDKNELLRKYDTTERQIESIIGKNYIPSYPFYILTILQTLDGIGSKNSDYSLHGFYYEHLINQKIYSMIKDKDDISLLYNYITELSFMFFQLQKKELTIIEFNEFHDLYCQEYSIQSGGESILNALRGARILDFNGSVRISYSYIYYFFVAKYLANKLNQDSIKLTVSKLCKRVYREEPGSIIMFLTHLSKDPFIIKELVSNAKQLFANIPIVKFDEDILNINKLVNEIPQQVLELVSTEDKRGKYLKDRDEDEMIEKGNKTNDYSEEEITEDSPQFDLLTEITMALKTIDILGQLTKNYWGSMNGVDKYLVASETYYLGLRTINKYLLFIQEDKEDLILFIKDLVQNKTFKEQYLKKEIEETTSDFIFKLSFFASFGVVKRISRSIGYEKLSLVFQNILEKNNYNSVKLIDLSIKLDHYDKLPFKDIDLLKTDFNKNYLGMLVLRNLVIDYLYTFNIDYKEKQRICSILGITMQTQRLIEAKSVQKKTTN